MDATLNTGVEMDNWGFATLPNESTDLALHVQLCEQRYQQLLYKCEAIDTRIEELNNTLTEINSTLSKDKSQSYDKHMGWAIAIILALSGWIFHLLTK